MVKQLIHTLGTHTYNCCHEFLFFNDRAIKALPPPYSDLESTDGVLQNIIAQTQNPALPICLGKPQKNKSSTNGQAFKRGGGVKARPLRKK